MKSKRSVIIVGAGAFGVAAALELNRRGWQVTLTNPGPLPHPHASSTDISKAIRMDYGRDAFYTDLAIEAMERWRVWNEEWPEPLYHEVGFLLMTREPMEAGSFEADAFELLSKRGLPLTRMGSEQLGQRFPAWNPAAYVDGYLNPTCGWAASGQVVAQLIERAKGEGVSIRDGLRCERLLESDQAVQGIVSEDGQTLHADRVIVAAGAWTSFLLPELVDVMWPVAQPVLQFLPEDPEPFRAPRFTVWAADIQRTGWYGFPVNKQGILKVGHHGPGQVYRAGDPLVPVAEEESRFRAFLRETFPSAATAPLVGKRLCLYCDTCDGDFWIDHHPQRTNLIVACGGSGHGFKFVPVLGAVIANAVEGQADPRLARFAWRQPQKRRFEQARFVGEPDALG